MTIPLPDLDDHSYQDLITKARTLVPSLYQEWTNFNPSDPGITLIELLAWVVEMVLYRVNEIPDDNVWGYLKFLNGPDWSPTREENLATAIQQSITTLRQLDRAVTTADYEYLALTYQPAQIRRAFCLKDRNLCLKGPGATQAAPGHVSLIIVPSSANPQDHQPTPTDPLRQELWRFLKDRRLLGVRHHVVAPTYVRVTVQANLYLHRDARPDIAFSEAQTALLTYFDPLQGGQDQCGWPFGRHLFASDVYALLDTLPSVAYLNNVQLTAQNDTLFNGIPQTDEIPISDYQLLSIDATQLKVITADGYRYCLQADQTVQLCKEGKMS